MSPHDLKSPRNAEIPKPDRASIILSEHPFESRDRRIAEGSGAVSALLGLTREPAQQQPHAEPCRPLGVLEGVLRTIPHRCDV